MNKVSRTDSGFRGRNLAGTASIGDMGGDLCGSLSERYKRAVKRCAVRCVDCFQELACEVECDRGQFVINVPTGTGERQERFTQIGTVNAAVDEFAPLQHGDGA